MIKKIIAYSVHHKLLTFIFVLLIITSGIYSLTHIPFGAVPDITNNQVQILTTTRDLSTEDVEQFITYPIELEMSNLPGIKEIRSISKFGLSVVTLVFEEKMGTYLPRQLISEKLQNLADKMPEGVGAPEMGPISTGLGEIYQYTLEVKPEYKDRYSLMDLRTIQDWIVKRNLSGIPGVVEVNTWGGHLKQFEVTIHPERLKAMNVSITEVYRALQENNGIAGGGYIEKTNRAYFIRSEGLIRSLKDIENIVVKKDGNFPVYIRDIGEVKYGHATRFGAITGNGEGEKVMGQVMMLKGANVSEVIKNVKERVEQISKSLPEGVYINPFLERTELLNKTTFTIAENLILGSLIVVFVVLLLLGNWRSALIISSVIPLSLLFALSLMYIFGIDANLMSLGAIDFGIIIDGAVIIVEFIAFKIGLDYIRLSKVPNNELHKSMDEITIESAGKMMHSAIFGQLIIIIVFFPILALTGVEGKLFKPMASVFIFALLGVMILGMTYVPAASALLLKPQDPEQETIAKKIIRFLNKLYEPSLRYALKHRKTVVSVAILLFVFSGYIFSKMGGEFVPTLDEGDFVIQPVLKTGTSLEKTIETTTKIEKILLEFPEVKQVVSRIGAAEVPTDPMSMEDSDVIIKLNPKKEWVTADTKDELAEKFKEALSVIPGIEYEFTQPIEMRFNELISGTRSDIAVKIYGEDLEILSSLANKIKTKIEKIPGAADIVVEKISGLPQIKIQLKRDKIASYGLNVHEINQTIAIALGGMPAGEVFEGEKRFDLVVRVDQSYKNNPENLKSLPVILPDGQQIPLEELADISLTKGPAKISRDAAKRRISIGINVRDRDLESVVEDIKKVIDNEIDLPAGYTVTYGGQFENLQSAKKRLLFVVPLALILIFILLYFAFGSVKLAGLIYTAVPMAVIGGIWSLWLRGMPFSISAGIGFIALFGVAVLNGIVLVEHFKEMEDQFKDKFQMLIQGAKDRLRPVLLTALAAMGGFLPMAVSQSAGAEVQRPLATVVIGGLFTSTLLTLIIIPIFYSWYLEFKKPKLNGKLGILLVFVLLGLSGKSIAQTDTVLDRIIEKVRNNNPAIKQARLQYEASTYLAKSYWEIPKTDISYEFDTSNEDPLNNQPYKTFIVSQEFKFPSWYLSRKKELQAASEKQRGAYILTENRILQEVSLVYFRILYEKQLLERLSFLDSLFQKYAYAADKRFSLGETGVLEKLNARSKSKLIRFRLQELQNSFQNNIRLLSAYLNEPVTEKWVSTIPALYPLSEEQVDKNLEKFLIEDQARVEERKFQWKSLKRDLLPDWYVSYGYGNNFLPGHGSYYLYAIGIKIPLFFGSQTGKIQTARLEWQAAQAQLEYKKQILETRVNNLSEQLKVQKEKLAFFSSEGENWSQQLYKSAEKAYKNGEINYMEYVISLENAFEIEKQLLENILKYNEIILQLKYLNN